jgi:hypothetical protein
MKKNETQKLRLSRETLRDLKSSDAQKVVGGVVGSCPSYCQSGLEPGCATCQTHLTDACG